MGMPRLSLADRLIGFLRHRASRQRLEHAITLLGPVRGRRILEVRCRRGHSLARLAARGARQVVGVDAEAKEIDLARSAATQQGVAERCEFACADLLGADLAGPFDACVAVGHFAHQPDPTRHLRRMAELTHGDLIASFPERFTPRVLPRLLHHLLHGRRLETFTVRQLERLARAAGLEEIRIHRISGDLLLHARSRGGARSDAQARPPASAGQAGETTATRTDPRIRPTSDDRRPSLNDGIHAG